MGMAGVATQAGKTVLLQKASFHTISTGPVGWRWLGCAQIRKGDAVQCPRCGSEAAPTHKFCSECGNLLELSCAYCGSTVGADARFCSECGSERVTTTEAPSTPDPTPERRLVTVLFADMVGFTPISEERDVEEVRDLLTEYIELATGLIGRYGGSVDKFIGDAVMAVWGSPVAHEDDAERAVRAALDFVEAIHRLAERTGISALQIRVGVATGEAAVLLNAPGQGMIAGDLVNTASRLQGAAQPGTVIVNEATYRAARVAISFEPHGDLSLKGKSEPVSTWRPVRVVAKRRGERQGDLIEPPFVGRDSELGLLKDLFAVTVRDRRPHLVSVMGVAGIGKSRLAWEFEKYVDGLVEVVSWHQGRSPAYGEGITFWALGEMVRRRARIAETDDPSSSLAKLVAAVDEHIPMLERSWVLKGLEALLGLESTSEFTSDELFATWRRFFEAIAEQTPVVMVFEDLQWADAGLVDYIESICSWSRAHPIFVVVLARPDLLDRRPAWGAGQRSYTAVHLEPLHDDAMTELLQGVVPDLPDDMVSDILVRAEGIPLYTVELVRSMVDRGHLAIDDEGTYQLVRRPKALLIPETLHALVASRLDALDAGARRLVQQASVLGQSFTVEGLTAITGSEMDQVIPRLERLVTTQMLDLDRDPRSPERGQYGFVQAVIREVAYSTLSLSDRRQLHLGVASYLSSLEDDELLPAIAHHLSSVVGVTTGAKKREIADRAITALERAASRAAMLGSHAQELTFLQQALELTEDPELMARLAESAGTACQMAGGWHRAEPYFIQALAWHGERGNHSDRARIAAALGDLQMMSGQVDQAGRLLEETRLSLEPGGDPRDLMLIDAQLARSYAFRGRGVEALVAADRALAAAGELRDSQMVADALVTRAWALWRNGRFDEANAVQEGALWLSAREGFTEPEMRARNNLGVSISWGDPRFAMSIFDDGIESVRRAGNLEWLARMTGRAIGIRFWLGDWDEAIALTCEAPRVGVSSFARESMMLGEMAILAWRGENQRASELFAELAAEAEDSDSTQALWILYSSEALMALGAADPSMLRAASERVRPYVLGDDPERWMTDAWAEIWDRVPSATTDYITHLRRAGDRRSLAWANALEGLGKLIEGDVSGVETVSKAADWFRQSGLVLDLALVRGELGILLPPDHPARGPALTEAEETWTQLGAEPQLARLKTLVG